MTPAESRLREAVEHGYPHHTLTIEDGRALAAEFDRLRERQFNADMCLDSVTEARRVLREHFGGNLAFLDDDLVRGVVKMKDEIDRLTRERDEARAERDHARQQSREWLKENGPGGWIDNLRAERDAMAKDAERYRWLRSQHWYTGTLAVVRDPKHAIKIGHEAPFGNRLDEAIDAALAQIEQERSEQKGGSVSDTIDTGDHVKHGPTGETWVVAFVEGGRLAWCGWPEGLADLADCTLVQKAAPGEREALLRSMAEIGGDDARGRYARRVLAKDEEAR